MVIKDVEREDIEFICKTLGCRPIASLDHFVPENLVKAELAEEISEPSGKFVKVGVYIILTCCLRMTSIDVIVKIASMYWASKDAQ